MGDVAVRVENLSKRYEIGSAERRYDTLRDQIMGSLKTAVSRNGHARLERNIIWALKDVSFEIKHGEVMGIIGRNGAGKSTLLKILSRITEPTSGWAEIFGRVGSLLEVGTGFHPELSGRENIYLNGAILGMKKWEIVKKFDEIVAFSEIEKFIDTPVKRYSSGMYVRLAFAVAAHLEPEILIVDEVLSVGDAAFQKKCIGKIGEVVQGGRTVLIVSHNLPVITSLCRHAVLLENGVKTVDGATQAVVSRYMGANTATGGERSWDAADPTAKSGRVRLAKARIVFQEQTVSDVDMSEPFVAEFDFEVLRDDVNLCSSIHVYNKNGTCAFVSGTASKILARGIYRHSYLFPAHLMNDGGYDITIILLTDTNRIEVMIDNALSFTVYETKCRGEYLGIVIGSVRPRLEVIEKVLSQPGDNA
jgi:lipopolysaccharide transport system ATP-binding protein